MNSFNGYSSLCDALRNKQLDVAKQLLNNKCKVNNNVRVHSETPLHLAIENGYQWIIFALLARRANVNVKNDAQETPLHCAVAKGNVLTVRLLIDAGADVNALNRHNKTPLHIAMGIKKKKRNPIAKMLLVKGANVDISDENGKTILPLAVKNGDLPEVKEILRYRPDVNSEANRRSLHAAKKLPVFKAMVDLLLGYGFNFRAEDANDADLLHAAVKQGCFKIVETLLNLGADVNTLHSSQGGVTLLHTSVTHKQFDITELLLSHGANVNAEDYGQNLAMTNAIDRNYTRVLTKLLNETVPNKEEIITELFHTALKNVKVEVVQFFLQHTNIDVKARDMFGRFALQSMASGNSWTMRYRDKNSILIDRFDDFQAILKILIDRGIDVNARETNGRTALHTAMMKKEGLNCGNVVELLLGFGADIDAKDENQATPLHLASYIGNIDAVNGLLQFGASIDEKDKLGRTPLHIAARYGRQQAVYRLVCSGADFNLTCNASYVPLNYAIFGLDDYYENPINRTQPHDELFMDVPHVSPGKKYGYDRTVSILMEHITAAKALDLRVSDENLRFVDHLHRSYHLEACHDELAEMKTIMFGDSNISYYDVLTKSMNRLAFYARNESFVEAIESTAYGFGLHYYYDLLNRRLKLGKERASKNLLDLGLKSFNALVGSVVPDDCALEIFDYLENKDLENLIKANPCGE